MVVVSQFGDVYFHKSVFVKTLLLFTIVKELLALLVLILVQF